MDDTHPGEVEDIGSTDSEADGSSIWVQRASEAYEASTDYMESSVLNQWDENIDNFRSRAATKNNGAGRKIFRPKTRSAIRSHEAALATALFSSNDLVSVDPADQNNQIQALSAKLNKALIQHRLEKTIPWFMTAIGGYQDTLNYGVVISKTYWKHEEEESGDFIPYIDDQGQFVRDEDGYVLGQQAAPNIIIDEPVIDLLAPENFRFDPNADWRNPISDSPYLIEQIPMYAGDVAERMGKSGDDKIGEPGWNEYSLSQILTAGGDTTKNKQTRQTREGDREDPIDTLKYNEFTTVWVHFNVYRINGVDMAYYTLGTTLLLSDPVPLTDIYKHGRKVYTLGVSTIEAHRNYPSALNELGSNTQNEINTLADQRYDNVRLVLNKRYFIKRQGNVDLPALANNRPGGGVFVDDPNGDVKVVDTPDVTSSSYAEQDRLNQDMDELMGTFSTSTVQSNRAMNETVGGMNLMATGANASQEYIMRTFIETWVEPVLRTLAKLEQYFETDETIMALAASKAGIPEEAAKDPEIMDRLIEQDLNITVNVGLGNTNPQQKMQKLMMAVNTTAGMPEMAAKTDWPAVVKEIWAFAGYGDGDRFVVGEKEGEPQEQGPPPELQAKQMELKAKAQEAQADREHDMAMLQLRLQQEGEQSIIEMNTRRELELIKLSESKGIKLEELRAKVGVEAAKDKTAREVAALKASLMSRELQLATITGSGI